MPLDDQTRERYLPLFRYRTQPPKQNDPLWTVTFRIPDPSRREGGVNYALTGNEAIERFVYFCAAFIQGASGKVLSRAPEINVDIPEGVYLEFAQTALPDKLYPSVEVVVRTSVAPRVKGVYSGREAGSAVLTFAATALPDLFAQFQRTVPGEH